MASADRSPEGLELPDDTHLLCGAPFEGTHSEEALAAEARRFQDFTVTCAQEGDPGRQVLLDAKVSGPPDPTPGNNQDRATTVVP